MGNYAIGGVVATMTLKDGDFLAGLDRAAKASDRQFAKIEAASRRAAGGNVALGKSALVSGEQLGAIGEKMRAYERRMASAEGQAFRLSEGMKKALSVGANASGIGGGETAAAAIDGISKAAFVAAPAVAAIGVALAAVGSVAALVWYDYEIKARNADLSNRILNDSLQATSDRLHDAASAREYFLKSGMRVGDLSTQWDAAAKAASDFSAEYKRAADAIASADARASGRAGAADAYRAAKVRADAAKAMSGASSREQVDAIASERDKTLARLEIASRVEAANRAKASAISLRGVTHGAGLGNSLALAEARSNTSDLAASLADQRDNIRADKVAGDAPAFRNIFGSPERTANALAAAKQAAAAAEKASSDAEKAAGKVSVADANRARNLRSYSDALDRYVYSTKKYEEARKAESALAERIAETARERAKVIADADEKLALSEAALKIEEQNLAALEAMPPAIEAATGAASRQKRAVEQLGSAWAAAKGHAAFSFSEIAGAFGESSNRRNARRAQELRSQADEAEKAGRFGNADKLRAKAEGFEAKVKRREYDETGKPLDRAAEATLKRQAEAATADVSRLMAESNASAKAGKLGRAAELASQAASKADRLRTAGFGSERLERSLEVGDTGAQAVKVNLPKISDGIGLIRQTLESMAGKLGIA